MVHVGWQIPEHLAWRMVGAQKDSQRISAPLPQWIVMVFCNIFTLMMDMPTWSVGHQLTTDGWCPIPHTSLPVNDCHVNAECAITLGTFKYLFKYTHKRGDMASLEVKPNNEIQ